MQTTKPKTKRTYVTIRDPETGESKHVTVYDATVGQVRDRITSEEPKPSPRRRAAQLA